MDALVEIAFKGKRREFYRWAGGGEDPLPVGAAVLVEADRGEDLGLVHSTGELAQLRSHRLPNGTHGALPDRKVLRRATDEEYAESRRLHDTEDEVARTRSRELVQQHGLVMKVTDAEWQFDRRKLTLYFTAEKRVDFRALVRDLASAFRARIELKQIGVRDEARRLSGIGRCGREYCSSSWLPELLPVNLGVAKDQRLSLNPTQISGACGRLMCCLRYEHEFYVQSRKRFPKEGRVLTTSVGEEKVISNDIFRETVTLRSTEGDTRVVPLHALKHELAGLPAGSGEQQPGDGRQHAPIVRFGEPGTAPRSRDARVLTVRDVTPSHDAAAPPERAPDAVSGHGREAPEGESGNLPSAADTPAQHEADAGTGNRDAGATAPDSADAQESAAARKRRRRGRRGGRRSRGMRDSATDGDDGAGSNGPDASHNQDKD